jgi:hypothetical protein
MATTRLRCGFPLLQDHHGFRRREKQGVAVASRKELNLCIDLAVIGFKLQRHPHHRGAHALRGHG